MKKFMDSIESRLYGVKTMDGNIKNIISSFNDLKKCGGKAIVVLEPKNDTRCEFTLNTLILSKVISMIIQEYNDELMSIKYDFDEYIEGEIRNEI